MKINTRCFQLTIMSILQFFSKRINNNFSVINNLSLSEDIFARASCLPDCQAFDYQASGDKFIKILLICTTKIGNQKF